MKKILLFIIASTFLWSGCGTIFSGTTDQISFSSSPSGTNVIINGAKVGKTPVTVPVKRNLSAPQVRIEKEGYDSNHVVLQNEFNMASLWNIFVWPGFIVDAASGALMKYPVTQYDSDLRASN